MSTEWTMMTISLKSSRENIEDDEMQGKVGQKEEWLRKKERKKTNERESSSVETITFALPWSFSKEGEKKGGFVEIGSLMLSRDARHKARCAPSWVSFLFVPANLWRADGVA